MRRLIAVLGEQRFDSWLLAAASALFSLFSMLSLFSVVSPSFWRTAPGASSCVTGRGFPAATRAQSRGTLGNALSLLLIFLSLATHSLQALSVIPPSFSDLVANAEQVVRIKVTKVSSRWDSTPQGPVIRTYVDCEPLRIMKGSVSKTLTLRFLGGQVGEEAMTVADMPKLAEGQTYIVFLAQNGQAMCPLVAAGHGSYPIVKDETTQLEHVSRSNFQRLRAVDDVEVPIITQAAHPALKAYSGPGMTRDEFEAAIITEVSREGK